MSNVMTYRFQYLYGDSDITSDLNAEQDATVFRAWSGAHGDVCIVEVARPPRGRWRIESSDLNLIEPSDGDLPVSAYARRFREPADAVAYMARRARALMAEAVCRCGKPGAECD